MFSLEPRPQAKSHGNPFKYQIRPAELDRRLGGIFGFLMFFLVFLFFYGFFRGLEWSHDVPDPSAIIFGPRSTQTGGMRAHFDQFFIFWTPLGPLGTPWDHLGPLGTPWDPLGPLGTLGTPWDSLGPLGTPDFKRITSRGSSLRGQTNPEKRHLFFQGSIFWRFRKLFACFWELRLFHPTFILAWI